MLASANYTASAPLAGLVSEIHKIKARMGTQSEKSLRFCSSRSRKYNVENKRNAPTRQIIHGTRSKKLNGARYYIAWSPAHAITRVQGLRCRARRNLGFHATHIGDVCDVKKLCVVEITLDRCVCFLKRKGKVKQCDKLVFLSRTDNNNDQADALLLLRLARFVYHLLLSSEFISSRIKIKILQFSHNISFLWKREQFECRQS